MLAVAEHIHAATAHRLPLRDRALREDRRRTRIHDRGCRIAGCAPGLRPPARAGRGRRGRASRRRRAGRAGGRRLVVERTGAACAGDEDGAACGFARRGAARLRRPCAPRGRDAGVDGGAPHARGDAPVDGPRPGDGHLAPRVRRGVRGVRPRLRLPGPRVGEPAEHAHQPALRRRCRVRAPARGDAARAAAAAGAGGEQPDARRADHRPGRHAPRGLSHEQPRGAERGGAGDPGARLHARGV